MGWGARSNMVNSVRVRTKHAKGSRQGAQGKTIDRPHFGVVFFFQIYGLGTHAHTNIETETLVQAKEKGAKRKEKKKKEIKRVIDNLALVCGDIDEHKYQRLIHHRDRKYRLIKGGRK